MEIVKTVVIGITVAIGGMFVSDLLGNFFSGMEYGNAAVLGMCMYLCVVIVVCTGIILSKMKEKKSSTEQRDEDK